MRVPKYLLCVDPGKHTGYAVLKNEQGSPGITLWDATVTLWDATVTLWDPDAGHLHPEHVFGEAYQTYVAAGDGLAIIEPFRHRPGPMKPDLSPVEVIGLIKKWLGEYQAQNKNHRYKTHILWKEPVQAKHMVSDDVLKRLGLFYTATSQGTAKHINDAIRHGVGWIIEQGHIWTCHTAFPRGGG